MIEAIKQGNPAAFEELYRLSHRKVYAFAHKHSRDDETAKDITQDVFLKIWHNRRTLSSTIPIDAQLLHITRQLVINNYRRSLVQKEAFDELTTKQAGHLSINEVDETLSRNELQVRYKYALDELPERRREIFELSRFENLSYDEIAERLNISRATVESQMVKALRFLRSRLTTLITLFGFFTIS